tara:strand:- start:92 stop:694 length:603 start_codon:yes stop_codon:yes gene_type:complete
MKELVFFDLDYTIAKTYETVRLWSPRGTRKIGERLYIPLSPREFDNIQIANDESIDESSFEEFKKIDIVNTTVVDSVCFLFNSYSLQDHNVKILSARPQIVEKYIYDFIEKNNLHLNQSFQFKGCGSSSPELKYTYIKKCIKDHNSNQIVLFDDSKKDLDYTSSKFQKDYNSTMSLIVCLVEIRGEEEVLKFKKITGEKK